MTLRAKTISNYYRRMYRKAKPIARLTKYNPYKKKIGKQNLYNRYSVKGSTSSDGKHGNFLTYVARADRTFSFEEDISRDTRRHMGKIKKSLQKG